MKIPPDVLTFLLKGGHLNVEERKKSGLWPSETLKFEDLAEHLAGVLEKEEWFPRSFQDHKDGYPVREGIYIQRKGSGKFICYAQRSSVRNANVVAERTETEFTTARDAAYFYLKWELHLPGRLDGWPVVSNEQKH